MNCRVCDKLIISDSVTYSNSQLIIDIPANTYDNGRCYALLVAQAIPATATIAAPVYITIGGVTTTTYPLLNCNGMQLTACNIKTHTRYGVVVRTNATSGSFVLTDKLSCGCGTRLPSLPVAATEAAGT